MLASTKEQHVKKILKRFPTEGYKQFSHQTRPFLTMAMAGAYFSHSTHMLSLF